MQPEKLVTGRMFLEAPRWRDGALYVSDMHADEVLRISPSGQTETIASVPTQPSGLGWLPDGDMLIVSMTDRRVLRRDETGTLHEHADLSSFIGKRANDMVVDRQGRAYIGNFGFDFELGESSASTILLRVDPDGSVQIAADELLFPNGMVITPDEKRLIVAQTFAQELTQFDIDPDGSLHGRRTFATLPEGAVPDGICLDEGGGIWVASPTTQETLRIEEGGRVTHRISTGDRLSIACMLGGDDGKTLYILTAEASAREACQKLQSAEILIHPVELAGAGWP